LKRTDRNDESREIRKEKEFFYVTNWDKNAYSFIEIINSARRSCVCTAESTVHGRGFAKEAMILGYI